MLSFRQVELRANQLLEEVEITKPPVPVEEIAKHLGAVVKRASSDGGVSGALYRKANVVVIGVNKKDAPVRQRFTVAHEIGHLRLHEDAVYIDRHYPGAPQVATGARTSGFHRDEISSRAIDPREIEANRFAAALLMPERLLRSDLKGLRIVSAVHVQRLCERYKVSPQAMIFRLMNLNVPLETA